MPSPRVPADEEMVVLFTEDERAAMWAQVDAWLGDAPEPTPGAGALGRWLERNALFLAQVNQKFATGEKTLPGAAGVQMMARAIRDWPAYAAKVLEVIRGSDQA